MPFRPQGEQATGKTRDCENRTFWKLSGLFIFLASLVPTPPPSYLNFLIVCWSRQGGGAGGWGLPLAIGAECDAACPRWEQTPVNMGPEQPSPSL